jgi:hypothetical protein
MTISFYDRIGVPRNADHATVSIACDVLLEAHARSSRDPAIVLAATVLSVVTTRRMYDYLLTRSEHTPPDNTINFTNDDEAEQYRMVADQWGFVIESQPDGIHRVSQVREQPSAVKELAAPTILPLKRGSRPPLRTLAFPPLDTAYKPGNAEKPSFAPRVNNEPHTRRDPMPTWPLDPVVCGSRVYYLSLHEGFIEHVVASPGVCQATCYIHGDRSVTFTAEDWHPVGFQRGFRPGDDIVLVGVRDPNHNQDQAVYAMVTSYGTGSSFEPPTVYKGWWESERVGRGFSSAQVHFDVRSRGDERRARYKYHFALRSASIAPFFAWTTQEGLRKLTLVANQYVAARYPDLKSLCKPR